VAEETDEQRRLRSLRGAPLLRSAFRRSARTRSSCRKVCSVDYQQPGEGFEAILQKVIFLMLILSFVLSFRGLSLTFKSKFQTSHIVSQTNVKDK